MNDGVTPKNIWDQSKNYEKLKRVSKDIIWTRIENQSLFGTPDLLGYK